MGASEDVISLCWSVHEKNDSEVDIETSQNSPMEKTQLFFEKRCLINDKTSIAYGIKPIIEDEEPIIDFQNTILLTVENGSKIELNGFYDIQKLLLIVEYVEAHANQISYSFSDLMLSFSGGIYFLYRYTNPDISIGLNIQDIERLRKILLIFNDHWGRYNNIQVEKFFNICVARHGTKIIDDTANVKNDENDGFMIELINEINLNFSELYKEAVGKVDINVLREAMFLLNFLK